MTSGKKGISVISVLQNFYCSGKFAREIRNSSNYFGLFRNSCDQTINSRAARDLGLTHAWKSAEKDLSKTEFPYAFCDLTSKGQLSNYRLYTDILSRVRVCYNSFGMKGYMVPEPVFLKHFKILAEKNGEVKAIENNANTGKELSELCSKRKKVLSSSKKKAKKEKLDRPLIKL